jgi:TonB family protein
MFQISQCRILLCAIHLAFFALLLLAGCRSTPSPHPAAVADTKTAPKEAPKKIMAGVGPPSPDCGRMIHHARAVYSKEAKKAHIEGTVRFNILVTRTGEVGDLQLVSGNPLLVPAALAAVKQWRWAPCLLNGEPIEIKTTADVSFTLSQ